MFMSQFLGTTELYQTFQCILPCRPLKIVLKLVSCPYEHLGTHETVINYLTCPNPFSTCVVIRIYGLAIEANGPTSVHTVERVTPQNKIFLAPNLPARYPPNS